MKKRLLLNSSLLILSNTFVFTNSFVHPSHLSVQAQEATTIEEVYEVMTQQGPITDKQWNSIPAEDWLRYANEAGPTMYMDNIFYKAYIEHRSVFTDEFNRIYSIMEQKFKINANEFNSYIVNEFNALDVLMKAKYDDGSGNRLTSVAEKISTHDENQWNQGVSQLSRQEAIERVNLHNEAESMKSNIIYLSGLSSEKLNQITNEMYFEAAVVHAMKNPLGGDSGTQVAVFKSLYPSLYTSNSAIGISELTREKAIERVNSHDEAEAMKTNVLKLSNIPSENLNKITDDMFFEAAVVHAMKNPLGGDYGTQLAVFKSLYPELYRTMEESQDIKLPRTRNKSVEIVRNTSLDKKIPDFLSMGVKKETIDKIPQEVFHEASVQYLMLHVDANDFTKVVEFFMNLYPEYFIDNTTSNNQSREEQLKKIQENKEKLLSEQSKTDINYLSLEDNQIFTFEEGEFKVTNVYLLVPGEAGNQSDNYLFGIHYEFTNKTDKDIIAPQVIFEHHSTASQLVNDQPVPLNKGSYHMLLQDEESKQNNTIFEDSFIVKSNESLEGTLYYEVPNTENDLIWSIIENNTVNSYRIITQDLQKLPYQSASYISNSDNQLGYLFDFERLYLVFSNSANTSDWENKEGITINPDITSLSKEAKNHYNHLIEQLGNDIKLITLENINYILEGGKINVTIGENEEVILQLMTETKWDSFSDDSNNIFELVSIN